MESQCEVCLQPLLGPKLDLGYHPLCDDLVKIGDSVASRKYHQEIALCTNCLTAQQLHQVDKEILFKGDYHYRASLTKDVLNGMSDLVEKTISRLKTDNILPLILDVGCNDGSLLGLFKERTECKTIGVDPTNAILEHAGKIDIPIQGFFDEKIAEQILNQVGIPDVITFTNVFAHIENFQGLLLALRILIGPKTLIVIENHYLGSIIQRDQFDTFYHEHPRTYSAKSFKVIAEQLGVEIHAIEFPSRYGGNIRVSMSQSISSTSNLNSMPNEGTFVEEFSSLQEKYESWLREAREAVLDLVATGTFVGKSLPGRAVMLISALGLTSKEMPFVFEQPNSPKVGYYVPGTDIEIISDKLLIDKGYHQMVLWSWHISDEVLEYLKDLGFKGEVWTPLPKFSFKTGI
jgi:SAM-dependent methyltransferase